MGAGRTRQGGAVAGEAASAAEEGCLPTAGDGAGAMPAFVILQPDGVRQSFTCSSHSREDAQH